MSQCGVKLGFRCAICLNKTYKNSFKISSFVASFQADTGPMCGQINLKFINLIPMICRLCARHGLKIAVKCVNCPPLPQYLRVSAWCNAHLSEVQKKNQCWKP